MKLKTGDRIVIDMTAHGMGGIYLFATVIAPETRPHVGVYVKFTDGNDGYIPNRGISLAYSK